MKKSKVQNETELNPLCIRCSRRCKQRKNQILLTCPKFKEKDKQLEIKFPGIKKR